MPLGNVNINGEHGAPVYRKSQFERAKHANRFWKIIPIASGITTLVTLVASLVFSAHHMHGLATDFRIAYEANGAILFVLLVKKYFDRLYSSQHNQNEIKPKEAQINQIPMQIPTEPEEPKIYSIFQGAIAYILFKLVLVNMKINLNEEDAKEIHQALRAIHEKKSKNASEYLGELVEIAEYLKVDAGILDGFLQSFLNEYDEKKVLHLEICQKVLINNIGLAKGKVKLVRTVDKKGKETISVEKPLEEECLLKMIFQAEKSLKIA